MAFQVSAETVRRWLHQLGWRWKRAKLVAKDTDPERSSRLAQIRFVWETLRCREALLFADELDIHLLAKTGYQWMPKGTQVEIMTPGKKEKHYLAGGWDIRTGKVHHCFAARKTNQLFRDLLEHDRKSVTRLAGMTGFMSWPTTTASTMPSRSRHGFRLIHASSCSGCRPTAREPIRSSASSATRMTKSHGITNGNDYATWWPTWSRHLKHNGPWPYQLSSIYQEPEVTAALKQLRSQPRAA